MSDIDAVNPYAAPQAERGLNQPYSRFGASRYVAFMQDGALAVEKLAELPEVCVKCARIDNLTTRRVKFQWYPRWVYVFLLCNVIILAFVALLTRKSGALTLPICNDCQAQWKKGSWAWGGGLIATFTLPFILGSIFSSAGVGLVLFFGGLIGSIVTYLVMARP